ncbi:MAG: proline-rich domain-containing protein [Bacteroidales bacterium]|nr:proline-rich domain-containing protein [Bacteroidales bacterium]
MKKFFNLAVAMSVIASSLYFVSCGDDDDEEEPTKKEHVNDEPQNKPSDDQGDPNQGGDNNQGDPNQGGDNNQGDQKQGGDNNQGDQKHIGEPQTSVKVAVGDTFLMSNEKLGLKDKKMIVAAIFRDQIVLNVYGTILYMGSNGDNRPYAFKFNSDGSPSACYYKDASLYPDKVLFVCKDDFVIASGTLDTSSVISSAAGETTFRKVN